MEAVTHRVVIRRSQSSAVPSEQSIYPLDVARQNTGRVGHSHFVEEVYKSC